MNSTLHMDTRQDDDNIYLNIDDSHFILNKNDFYKTASYIMRGNVELKYLKNHNIKAFVFNDELKSYNINNFVLLKSLSEHFINYRILEIIDKIVTIVINPKQTKDFKYLFKKNRCKKLQHPFGNENGFIFSNGLSPFEMYYYKGFYYEVFFEIPCLRVCSKEWLPLDMYTQSFLWSGALVFDGFVFSSLETRVVYYIIKSVFYYHLFPNVYIHFIKDNKELLSNEAVLKQLVSVFSFSTDTLIHDLTNDNYFSFVESFYSLKGI